MLNQARAGHVINHQMNYFPTSERFRPSNAKYLFNIFFPLDLENISSTMYLYFLSWI